ncbi:hypothetical protein [Desulfovibrio sp. UCD-KL4C]|uniref:hypothetical protein n=1 Tax=Desulfovibrio sp. UCD-KL4C TaxID=2578120 RepID=UPI0025BB6B77|nr:hypothetical protein [Desulfovibrio sp. UCD-KL4C]
MSKCVKILVLMFVLSLPGYAFASPVYLTLQGSLASVTGSLAQKTGLNIGDIVKYQIMIDDTKVGTFTPGWWSMDKRGSMYASSDGFLKGGYTNIKQNWLIDKNWGNNQLKIHAGNDESNIYATSDISYNDLRRGSVISSLSEQALGYNYNGNMEFSKLNFKDVTVTNISNTAPTPLPGALLLMGGGLGLVGSIRRKFVKKI